MGMLCSLFVINFDLLSHFSTCSTSLRVFLVLSELMVSEMEKKDPEYSASNS